MQLIRSISIFCLVLLPVAALAQNEVEDTISFFSTRQTEIDFLGSYYQQTGDHSAVTGGEGTETLHDYASKIVINVPLSDKKALNIETGISYFTSASNDNIDPNTISSASYDDLPIHIDATYSVNDTARRRSYGFRGRISHEQYFGSVSAGGFFTRISRDKNREVKFTGQFYLDKWALYYSISKLYPVELKGLGDLVDTNKRLTSDLSVSLSQVINKRMQLSILIGLIYQNGLLSAPYHRVYIDNENLPRLERLPQNKFRYPLAFRLNYFVGDRVIIRSFYRYYRDDWGMSAHTINFEIPLKITNFFSVYPFYRYHHQTAVRYFAPFAMHQPDDHFYTSDYDLSAFSSQFAGGGIRYAPAFGIGKFRLSASAKKYFTFKELGLRIGAYRRSDGLRASIYSFNLGFLH